MTRLASTAATLDRRTILASALAVLAGTAVAFMDSRPGFDDTGVTAVALFGAAALTAAIGGRRPLLFALLVGVWTPLVEIPAGGSTGSLLALVFAAAGATVGCLARRTSSRT
jgi:hypothetical protein